MKKQIIMLSGMSNSGKDTLMDCVKSTLEEGGVQYLELRRHTSRGKKPRDTAAAIDPVYGIAIPELRDRENYFGYYIKYGTHNAYLTADVCGWWTDRDRHVLLALAGGTAELRNFRNEFLDTLVPLQKKEKHDLVMHWILVKTPAHDCFGRMIATEDRTDIEELYRRVRELAYDGPKLEELEDDKFFQRVIANPSTPENKDAVRAKGSVRGGKALIVRINSGVSLHVLTLVTFRSIIAPSFQRAGYGAYENFHHLLRLAQEDDSSYQAATSISRRSSSSTVHSLITSLH